uniref:holo-[acyl-carrier-protein] synthase n=1 Tax=Polytomella parva TaxID=51329 RepID=A0A7S0VD91_9CHLO
MSIRWCVYLSDEYEKSYLVSNFQQILLSLPNYEQLEVQKFIYEEDRLKSLLSRVLQRLAVSYILKIPYNEVKIDRTAWNKPYCSNQKPHWAPNLNFNVSHEGDVVALAAESVLIVGIDVVAPLCRRKGPPVNAALHIERLRCSFSSFEMDEFAKASSQDNSDDNDINFARDQSITNLERCFQRFWSLKEAFAKLRGDGLGLSPLSRACFGRPLASRIHTYTARVARADQWKEKDAIEEVEASVRDTRNGEEEKKCWGDEEEKSKARGKNKAKEEIDCRETEKSRKGKHEESLGSEIQNELLSIFQITGSKMESATVSLDGVFIPEVTFRIHWLPMGYCVALALGPPSLIVDPITKGFKTSCQKPQLSPMEVETAQLESKNGSQMFQMLSIKMILRMMKQRGATIEYLNE